MQSSMYYCKAISHNEQQYVICKSKAFNNSYRIYWFYTLYHNDKALIDGHFQLDYSHNLLEKTG